MRGPQSSRRGFSLLIVTMIIALVSLGAVALMSMLNAELSVIGRRRQAWSARQIADGGAREMLADAQAPLPDFGSPGLSLQYTVPANSAVAKPDQGASYTGTFRLMRFVPVTESSEGSVRALVYEIEAVSRYAGDDSSAKVTAEIYRTVAVAPGVIPPRMHAR